MISSAHKDEARICTECGHYMSKATLDELEDFTRDDRSSDDPEFYDLWVCETCGHKYHDLVGENQG